MDTKTGDWKTVKNLETYECSNFGNFRTKSSKRKLNTRLKNGYSIITLTNSENKRRSFLAHILIATTWIENPENKKTVDHINKIRNDNRVENLRWATHKEQAENIDYTKRKINNYRKVWKCDKDTGEKIELYNSVNEAAKSISDTSTSGNICACITGKTTSAYGYKWIHEKEKEIINEIFKHYLSYAKNNYYVSNKGRVKNNKRILKPLELDGYHHININRKYLRIHQLVAQLFLDNPNNYNIVNHKDGNKSNNDVSNLEWINSTNNIIHAINTGLIEKIKKVVHYTEDGKIIKIYNSCMEASNDLKIGRGSINKCCQKKNKYMWTK